MTRPFLASLCVLALAGCDGEMPVDPDAGVMADTGLPDSGYDAGPPLACSDLTRIEPAMGATESVMFDTTMTETRPRDLGVGCGNDDPELRWAPQEVLEIVVPGSGPVQVEVNTAFAETDFSFNTVLQFRDTCEAVPSGIIPPSCFDDQSREEARARGAITVEGGSTIYVIVTGYSEPPAAAMQVDEGPVRVDVTVTQNQAPTLTSGALLLAGDDVLVVAQGNDPEADPRGVAVNFYDRAGALIDIYGDGVATVDGDAFLIPFDPPPMMADFDGRGFVPSSAVNLGPFIRANMIPRVGLRVYDGGWAISDMLMVDVADAVEVGLGEACGTEAVCRQEMRCVDGLCEPTPSAAAVCDAAVPFDMLMPVGDTSASQTLASTVAAGAGTFQPVSGCTGDSRAFAGAERVFEVTVPEGSYDLLLTTDLDGTMETDTLLYLRGACADSGTVLACNDDIRAGNTRSSIEVRDDALEAGTYYAVVERYGGLMSGSLPFELQATLRPVREIGESCDDAGLENRCREGACVSGVCR